MGILKGSKKSEWSMQPCDQTLLFKKNVYHILKRREGEEASATVAAAISTFLNLSCQEGHCCHPKNMLAFALPENLEERPRGAAAGHMAKSPHPYIDVGKNIPGEMLEGCAGLSQTTYSPGSNWIGQFCDGVDLLMPPEAVKNPPLTG